MSLLKLCGLVLLVALTLLLLREAGGRGATPVLLGGGLLLLLFLVEHYRSLLGFLDTLPGGELLGSAVSLSLRVLGLAFLTETTAGICRDLGEAGLATRLEWCGRAEILLISLPTLEEVLRVAVSYLSG